MDDPAAGGDDLIVQRVDIRARIRGEGDHVDPLVGGLAQPDDIGFVRPFRGEIHHAVLFADVLQAPAVAIEGALGLQIGDAIADEADFGDACHVSLLDGFVMNRMRR